MYKKADIVRLKFCDDWKGIAIVLNEGIPAKEFKKIYWSQIILWYDGTKDSFSSVRVGESHRGPWISIRLEDIYYYAMYKEQKGWVQDRYMKCMSTQHSK